MVTMTTTQLGPDRMRPAVPSHAVALSMTAGRSDDSVDPGFCGATGLSTLAVTAGVKCTNSVGNRTQIERPTRHLGTRST